MKKSHDIKILWLSDIHFSTRYRSLVSNEKFKNYFSHFRTKIDGEHTREAPIEYIFLTGDISQSGSAEDYQFFWEFFLQPLLDIFLLKTGLPLPRVITIPGNHDVQWKNTGFLKDYLSNISPPLKQNIRRSTYLAEVGNETKFRALFTDYQSFLNTSVQQFQEGRYKEFFNLASVPELTVSTAYIDTRLYGYIIDRKNKAIFILLNTAWFSLGDQFNDLFAAEIINEDQFDQIIKHDSAYLKNYITEEILKKKDDITEFSNQVTGVNFLECEALNKYFKEYPDYLIISCMHHPLNWLAWDEYYTYDAGNHELNANKLSEILRSSDVLLSGHEHIPMNFLPEKIYSDTVHLKSGCFLFDNQDALLNLSHSWFSVLSIKGEQGLLHQKKYYFDDTEGKNNWEMKQAPEILLPKKNDRYKLMPERKSTLCSLITSGREGKLLRYIQSAVPHEKKPEKLILLSNEMGDAFSVYRSIPETTGDIYIIAQKEDFYTTINNEKFFGFIDQVMQENDYSFRTFRFLVPDLFVDGPFKKEYEDTLCTRQQILQKIVKRADSLFNIFRSSFFVRFEEGSEVQAKIENFKKYQDLCFVNHIIPYWILEKYWT